MIFLDLGYQPFANKYLTKVNQKEKKYRLLIDFNKKTKIVSIKKKFLSKEIFKKDYPYRSSMSKTMKKSFKMGMDTGFISVSPVSMKSLASNLPV